ncbi:MAG: type II toxin-antitoxin system RelE/ParE family toxin [Chloroflexi bacterium]|nr:type II toxin-antitoxin system RelE/ParE family toxin [Chloroflexota bacterium]
MRSLLWTNQARDDLAAIREFISRDSAHYADIVVARLIAAVDRIARFPESGRVVPEFVDASLREVISRPYRIVYRLVGPDRIHILTVHHGARMFPG